MDKRTLAPIQLGQKEDTAMNTAQEYHSTGHLCQLLQRSPRAIAKAAEGLGIAPALKLNGIGHWDADQTEKLIDHFRDRQDTKR